MAAVTLSVAAAERTANAGTSVLKGGDIPGSGSVPDDVLDQIDDIVPPGQNLHAADSGWQHPALASAGLRRRNER